MKRILSMTVGLGLLLSTGALAFNDEHKADPHKTGKKDDHHDKEKKTDDQKKDEHKKDDHKKDHGN
jgi:hypothetical protein